MGLYNAGMTDFFRLAPKLYAEQKKTQKLRLIDFFDLTWKIQTEKLGFKKSILLWYKIGSYIRSHSWQMFYFFDQLARPLIGSRRYPFLFFHDRCFNPLIRNPPCNIITMIVAIAWFYGVLTPVYRFLDGPSQIVDLIPRPVENPKT